MRTPFAPPFGISTSAVTECAWSWRREARAGCSSGLGRVALVAALVVLLGAAVAYGAEHTTNPGFATYGDAVWWGIVTLTTVGLTREVAALREQITGLAEEIARLAAPDRSAELHEG
jgi:hypothetical protein